MTIAQRLGFILFCPVTIALAVLRGAGQIDLSWGFVLLPMVFWLGLFLGSVFAWYLDSPARIAAAPPDSN